MSESTGAPDLPPRSTLADRLPGTPESVQVGGEFLARALRLLQSFRGIDPSQATVRLSGELLYAAVMQDCSQAPFRKNGQAFYNVNIIAAGGAGAFSTSIIRNVSADIGNLKVAVIDEVRVGGGTSDFDFGFAKVAIGGGGYNALLPVAWVPEFPPSLSQIPGGSLTPTLSGLVQSDVIQLTSGYPTSLFIGATNAERIGKDSYNSGSGAYTRLLLDGAILWPGQDFWVQQQTANLAMNVNIRGRVFLLGQQLGDFR